MNPEIKKAAAKIILAVIETIKEVGRAPESSIYLALNQYGCSLDQYYQIVSMLESVGVIRRESNELVWINR